MIEKSNYAKYPIHETLEITDSIKKDWNSILNVIADLLKIPSALIMKVNKESIEIHSANTNKKESPYKVGDEEKLDSGLYCEYVMSTRRKLLIPNALKAPNWSNNPDVPLGMISYLGYPLIWPTGKIFGTICILDSKENHFDNKHEQLIYHFSKIISHDLERIYQAHLLKKKNKWLENLASIMSHDLRAPIATITSISNYYKAEAAQLSKEELLDAIAMISRASESAIDRCNSLYELSVMKKPPQIELIDLNAIISDIIKDLELDGTEKIEIKTIPKIKGTKKLFHTIFQKVLGNCLKYKKEDTPLEIFIDYEVNKNHNNIILKVIDNGIGFPREDVDKVFELFYRANQGKDRNIKGDGLGLPTVKQAVECLGGSVWAKSESNKGTEVYLQLHIN